MRSMKGGVLARAVSAAWQTAAEMCIYIYIYLYTYIYIYIYIYIYSQQPATGRHSQRATHERKSKI